MSKSSINTTPEKYLGDGSLEYQELIHFLFGRINYERSPDLAKTTASFQLDRMQALLDRIGNPQNDIQCVHIAGSKGKGSTATFMARILEASGRRIGLFTSPHAHRFEERFTVNGQLPEESDVVNVLQRLQEVTHELDREKGGGPTFFELATAAGWLYFKKQNVDLAVIEVGMGGRLDSTNLCNPIVSIITSISKDHTRLLGETEELIAREKAGIIKPGIPVVSGVLHPGAAEVVHEVAKTQDAKLFQFGREFTVEGTPPGNYVSGALPCWTFEFHCEMESFKGLNLVMPGEHQVRNASLAIMASQILRQAKFEISDAKLRQGVESAKLPLRVEVLNSEPLLVVDAAHNPASIQALCATIAPVQTEKRICLFAASRDKDTAELLQSLNGHFDQVILTAYQNNPRAVPISELTEIAKSALSVPYVVEESPSLAIQRTIREVDNNGLICATGSFFLAAEVKQLWNELQAS